MDIIASNFENISYGMLFVGLLVYNMKKSDERESLMREQLNKTVPILEGILDRLCKIEKVVDNNVDNKNNKNENGGN
jgi:hypothetical protein